MDLLCYWSFYPVALAGGAAQFNGQLKIDNGQLFYNQMTINKNEWIYCVICRFILSHWLEAQHAAPLLGSIINCQLSIVNFQLMKLSISFCMPVLFAESSSPAIIRTEWFV